MAKKKTPANAGCCLLMLLYFPFGVIMELAKTYGGTKKRRRRY